MIFTIIIMTIINISIIGGGGVVISIVLLFFTHCGGGGGGNFATIILNCRFIWVIQCKILLVTRKDQILSLNTVFIRYWHRSL